MSLNKEKDSHIHDRFKLHFLSLKGLVLIQRFPVSDSRGYLERMFCSEAFTKAGLQKTIVQVNHTLTRRSGTVRGMHFQLPPHSETKIVSCLKGEVFDVAVDLRADSATFLQWQGEILSNKNCKALFIPEGFAHGFQTLTEDCEMLYFHTASYNPLAEAGLHPQDPALSIDWHLPISELSQRDSKHPYLEVDYGGITL